MPRLHIVVPPLYSNVLSLHVRSCEYLRLESMSWYSPNPRTDLPVVVVVVGVYRREECRVRIDILALLEYNVPTQRNPIFATECDPKSSASS